MNRPVDVKAMLDAGVYNATAQRDDQAALVADLARDPWGNSKLVSASRILADHESRLAAALEARAAVAELVEAATRMRRFVDSSTIRASKSAVAGWDVNCARMDAALAKFTPQA